METLGRPDPALREPQDPREHGIRQLAALRAEIRILPAVEVGPLRRSMDELAKERCELDTAIQQANWATDLVEG
jgi:hypothetical protein